MKTIEERAKAFCENNICVDCEDRKNCDRGCVGCCIPTFSALEWLIQFGKSERAELTRWHDPNITPDNNKPVIICTSPGIYYIAAYDKQFNYWFTGNGSFYRHEIIGWREIHE
jgi:hypothetical protein